MTKKKNWIKGAIKHPGALHREMGIAEGKKIPVKKLQGAIKKGGKEGKRAQLAMTLRGFRKNKKAKPGDLYKKRKSLMGVIQGVEGKIQDVGRGVRRGVGNYIQKVKDADTNFSNRSTNTNYYKGNDYWATHKDKKPRKMGGKC